MTKTILQVYSNEAVALMQIRRRAINTHKPLCCFIIPEDMHFQPFWVQAGRSRSGLEIKVALGDG